MLNVVLTSKGKLVYIGGNVGITENGRDVPITSTAGIAEDGSSTILGSIYPVVIKRTNTGKVVFNSKWTTNGERVKLNNNFTFNGEKILGTFGDHSASTTSFFAKYETAGGMACTQYNSYLNNTIYTADGRKVIGNPGDNVMWTIDGEMVFLYFKGLTIPDHNTYSNLLTAGEIAGWSSE